MPSWVARVFIHSIAQNAATRKCNPAVCPGSREAWIRISTCVTKGCTHAWEYSGSQGGQQGLGLYIEVIIFFRNVLRVLCTSASPDRARMICLAHLFQLLLEVAQYSEKNIGVICPWAQIPSLPLTESESHSVMSNSLPTHGLYSPWNSPGQNTGVGSCSLLQGGSSQPRDQTQVTRIAGGFFTS